MQLQEIFLLTAGAGIAWLGGAVSYWWRYRAKRNATANKVLYFLLEIWISSKTMEKISWDRSMNLMREFLEFELPDQDWSEVSQVSPDLGNSTFIKWQFESQLELTKESGDRLEHYLEEFSAFSATTAFEISRGGFITKHVTKLTDFFNRVDEVDREFRNRVTDETIRRARLAFIEKLEDSIQAISVKFLLDQWPATRWLLKKDFSEVTEEERNAAYEIFSTTVLPAMKASLKSEPGASAQ